MTMVTPPTTVHNNTVEMQLLVADVHCWDKAFMMMPSGNSVYHISRYPKHTFSKIGTKE